VQSHQTEKPVKLTPLYFLNSKDWWNSTLKPWGHRLNAVVINDENASPKIMYVDAWKTFNQVMSTEEMENKTGNRNFELRYHKGPLNNLSHSMTQSKFRMK